MHPLLLCFLPLLLSLPRLESSPVGSRSDSVASFTLLHLNDFHSHFEEVNEITGRCHAEMAEDGACFGGAARIMTVVKEARREAAGAVEEDGDVMLLNAGDFYQGTIWYSLFKYRPVLEFSNALNYTAASLGNHEFDDGAEGLADFTREADFPLLAANMVQEEDDRVPALEFSRSTVVVTADGFRVGIVGYVTEDTPRLAHSNANLHFLPVVESVQREARRLRHRSDDPVDAVIALGHAGYQVDLELARRVVEVDLVVGGHSHSFLYTGQELPSVETPEGPYPTYVHQEGSAKVVPVVQAYCYSKYLGRLRLNFDRETGRLLSPADGRGVSEAEVLLLDSSVKKDPGVEKAMDRYRARMSEYYQVVGSTAVFLEKVEQRESNLGDVVADSMMEAWPPGEADMAFINDGGLRASLVRGSITGEDIFNVLPFNNTCDRLVMSGRSIKAILESYASQLCPNQTCKASTFLQVSGIQVTLDVREGNKGNRVSRILTRRCPEKRRPGCEEEEEELCEMDPDQEYRVITSSFLAMGKSKRHNFASLLTKREVGPVNDFDAFKSFVARSSPITQQVEGRIVLNYHVS